MRAKTEFWEDLEITQYLVRAAWHQFEKDLENGTQLFLTKFGRMYMAVGLAALLALSFAGVLHPFHWAYVGIKWMVILVVVAYPISILGWTCKVQYQLIRDRRRGISYSRRLRAALRRCLFKGKCPNRRTKLHLLRNYLIWYGLGSFGDNGIRVWLFVSEAQRFVRMYFFLFREALRATFRVFILRGQP